MKKPIIAIIALCVCSNTFAQNLKINPNRISHLTSQLLSDKIIFDHNVQITSHVVTQWNEFDQNPRYFGISGNYLPSEALKGAILGAGINALLYGPFANYVVHTNFGILKSDRYYTSGFYTNIRPEIELKSFNNSVLVWHEAEPNQYLVKNATRLGLSFETGGWISFDRRRKLLFLEFNSHNVFEKNSSGSLLNRILTGNYQIKWINQGNESRTQTSYQLYFIDFQRLIHSISFQYFSPYKIYSGLKLDSNLQSICMVGIQLPINASSFGILDINYEYGYSFARFGNLIGDTHALNIRILGEF